MASVAFAGLAALLLALDRFTKAWASTTLALGDPHPLIGNAIRLTHVHNSGGAFGVLARVPGLFVAVKFMLATGVLFLAKTPGYSQDLMSYLFGNILMVTPRDLWLMAALDVLVVVLGLVFYNQFLAVCFDEEFARLRVGIGPGPATEEHAEFVLSEFTAAERPIVAEAIERAADAAECWITQGLQEAMNRFNRPKDDED